MIFVWYAIIFILLGVLVLGNIIISEIAKFVVYINDSEPYFNSFWFAVFVYFIGFLASIALSYLILIFINKVCENML